MINTYITAAVTDLVLIKNRYFRNFIVWYFCSLKTARILNTAAKLMILVKI